MKKTALVLFVGFVLAAGTASASVHTHARQTVNISVVNQPVNGFDYHIATQGTDVKVDMRGAQGDHTPFTVRVIRVGQSQAVFHQTSAWRDDLNCETIGSGFSVSTGGYVFYIEASLTDRQPPSGAFVVTP